MHSTKLFSFFSICSYFTVFFLTIKSTIQLFALKNCTASSIYFSSYFCLLFFFSFINEASCVSYFFCHKIYFTVYWPNTKDSSDIYCFHIHWLHTYIQLNFSLNLLRFSSFITCFFPSSYSLLIHFVSPFLLRNFIYNRTK